MMATFSAELLHKFGNSFQTFPSTSNIMLRNTSHNATDYNFCYLKLFCGLICIRFDLHFAFMLY